MTQVFSRRTALITGSAATAMAASTSRAQAARTLNLSTPKDCLYAVVKLRGDLSGKMALQWYTGVLSLLIPGKMPTPVCRYQGIIRSIWTPQPDGSFKYRTFDIGFFGDLQTGAPVQTLTNPLTGETVEPTQVRDGPIESVYSLNGVFANGATPDTSKTLSLPWIISGNDVWYNASFGFEYPNPLPPAQYPELSSTDTVVQRSQFTYKGRLSELQDEALTSAPMETIMVVTSTIHPWLKMGRTPGFQHIQTFSHKIAKLEESSPAMQEFLAKNLPDYLTAHTPFNGAGNSFETYKRQRVEKQG